MTTQYRKILVIDVGGTNIKLRTNGQRAVTKIPSGPTLTAAGMIAAVRTATADWQFDAVSIGYPGPVTRNKPHNEPHNLGPGWVGYPYQKAFPVPVRVINDAAMQALGGYRGGRMLFLGLGTGLGAALVVEGHLQPLELAHLPYRKGRAFEDYVGEASRKARGKRRWERFVIDVVAALRMAMQVETVLIGGGNARRLEHVLDRLPEGTRLGSNADAFRGGVRLWHPAHDRIAASIK
ncbi:MAG: ROK family protein [Gemmatimonadota bacterium]